MAAIADVDGVLPWLCSYKAMRVLTIFLNVRLSPGEEKENGKFAFYSIRARTQKFELHKITNYSKMHHIRQHLRIGSSCENGEGFFLTNTS